MPVRQFIQVAAFEEKIRALFGFVLVDPADIVHFGKRSKIFKIVRFVDKKTVYSEFLKCDHTILIALIIQLMQLSFYIFHLFFRAVLR